MFLFKRFFERRESLNFLFYCVALTHFPQRCKNAVLSASSAYRRAMTSSVCSSSQRASRHDISVYSEISGGAGGGGGNSEDGCLASSHDPITKLFLRVSDPTTVTLSCISAGGGGDGGRSSETLELHVEREEVEDWKTNRKRGGGGRGAVTVINLLSARGVELTWKCERPEESRLGPGDKKGDEYQESVKKCRIKGR